MKIQVMTIVAALWVATACAPVAPTPQPGIATMPGVVTGVPVIVPGDIGTGQSTDVPVGIMTACPCPSDVAITPSGSGVTISPPLVVCGCPAILITPPVDEASPTAPSAGQSVITLDDRGRTLTMHPGDTFLLDLGTDVYDWTVDIDNQAVLSRVLNIMVIRGAQGVYQAHVPGQTVLTARGDPPCRNSVPACEMPSLIFEITVIVQ